MKKLIFNLFDFGFDILLVIIFLAKFKANIYFSMVFLVYCILRTFLVKHIYIVIFINLLVIFTIFSGSISTMISKETDIITIMIVIILLLIIVITQIFTIIFKAFKFKIEKPPFCQKKFLRILGKICFAFDSIYYVTNILIAFIYPIILSVTVIIAFSGIYNSLNHYYNSSEYQGTDGLYYTLDNTRLKSVEYNNAIISFDDIVKLNKNNYLYFSAATYFTIGYGDIVPKGLYLRTITILQMIIAHVLNISIFALFGTLFYDFIKSKKVVKFKVTNKKE
jgi:hypothetical protein